MLDSVSLAEVIRRALTDPDNGLSIVPPVDTDVLEKSGEASITLRMGRWFVVLRQSSQPYFDVAADDSEIRAESRSARKYFVPFGREFILHPGRFVLASTLEWLRFPCHLGGYVGGKSTWARRGLIIETAAGIHPGFNGCLTLELANVGEVPIRIRPGMKICQIFVHAAAKGAYSSAGPLTGRRRPHLGRPSADPILKKLSAD